MTARRITQIQLDIEETFSIRRSTGFIQAHCPECDSLSALVTLSEAATLLNVAADIISEQIECGRLHSFKRSPDIDLVCFESLQRLALRLLTGNSHLHINPSKETSK